MRDAIRPVPSVHQTPVPRRTACVPRRHRVSSVEMAANTEEAERLRRQAGLTNPLGTPGGMKPPRFAVKSLRDHELAHEIAVSEPGPWKDACLAEGRRRLGVEP